MELQTRKPTRLKNYDYSREGAYFITICTHNRKNILCDIVGDGVYDIPKTTLFHCGEIVEKYIQKMNYQYDNVCVDKYVIMPNHVHAIVVIESGKDTPSLNTVIGSYKSAVSKQCHEINVDIKVWQRSYHDHIIRDQKRYELIWSYIDTNWYRWKDDKFYVE